MVRVSSNTVCCRFYFLMGKDAIFFSVWYYEWSDIFMIEKQRR